jgi:hypothetical protein
MFLSLGTTKVQTPVVPTSGLTIFAEVNVASNERFVSFILDNRHKWCLVESALEPDLLGIN